MTNGAFITDNFLLHSKEAEHLYHTYAVDQPIIDYHCHLPPDEIANNRAFDNITEVWINGDHYKWRAMRAYGVDEKFITGSATDLEKFEHWAKTVPHTLRNPLYHWTHLELKRYFDVDELLNPHNAVDIYQRTSDLLRQPTYSTQGLLKQMNVEVVCTTDDPIDDLKHHERLAQNTIKIKPAFRPDNAILINSPDYIEYLEKLSNVSDIHVNSFQSLCDALSKRMAYFHERGCRLSDHGLSFIAFAEFKYSELEPIFQKRFNGQYLEPQQEAKFQTAVLQFVCQAYYQLGWVQQFHLGALRNSNSRMLAKMGPNTGWDSIGAFPQAAGLSKLLDALDSSAQLTKTILYNLNPTDNELFATMAGNFNDGSIRGKMQYGSAWWFLDQKDGMEKQINALSNMGLLSCFVGMLTDSRSFLSYPRHEYFRRILCNLLGTEMANGELPHDYALIGNMVQSICYTNAKEYFDF